MNITKRGNTYRIQIYTGIKKNGKRQRITRTYKPPEGLTDRQSKQAALKFALDLENRIKRGGAVEYDKLTFTDFCALYFENHAPELKPITRQNYKYICNNLLIPYFGNMYIQNITPLVIRRWLTDLERQRGAGVLSSNTKKLYLTTLSALLTIAVKWDIIPDNPCKNVTISSKRPEVKALQAPEVARLLSNIDNYKDKRAVILIYIFLFTGVRISEAAGLKWSDINYQDKYIRISRECIYIAGAGYQIARPKSAAALRDIYIPDILLDKLSEYKTLQNEDIYNKGDLYNNEDFIVTRFNGAPLYADRIRQIIKQAFKFCGVEYITVHGLRHTYASLLIAGGVDVRTTAAQLGHSNPALTLNIYANAQNAAKKNAAARIAEILQPGVIPED